MPEQRVILITGASSGIGRTCAISLSKAYPSAAHPEKLVLVLSGRREAELKATADACREGTVCEICVGDVVSEEDVGKMFATVKEKYGRLDLLFNVSVAVMWRLAIICAAGS
jgi:NADP-dependent 3-hydroxy acid dehydrogenase YdfG